MSLLEVLHPVLGPWSPLRTSDCLAGAGPLFKLIDYDRNVLPLLAGVAVATPMNVIIVVSYMFMVPPHPKFLLLNRYKFALRLHVSSGTFEICTLLPILFASNPIPWVYAMATAALLHALSAIMLIPVLFGMKLFMNLCYGIIIILKVCLALNVALNTDCYIRVLSLATLHTTYAWVRFLYMLFQALRIFQGVRYTASVVLAGMVVLDMLGSLLNMFVIGAIMVGGIYLSFARNETRIRYTTEYSRDSTAFAKYQKEIRAARTSMTETAVARAAPAGRGRRTGVRLSGGANLEQEMHATAVFQMLSHGRDTIKFHDLAAFLGHFGLPLGDVRRIISNLRQRHVENKDGISFPSFMQDLAPVCNWTYQFLNSDEEDEQAIIEDQILMASDFTKLSHELHHISRRGHDEEEGLPRDNSFPEDADAAGQNQLDTVPHATRAAPCHAWSLKSEVVTTSSLMSEAWSNVVCDGAKDIP